MYPYLFLFFILVSSLGGALASEPTDDIELQRPVVIAHAPPTPSTPSKLTSVRRAAPFILSGTAAVTELVMLITDTPNRNATLEATVFWLAANVAGIANLYLDYKHLL